MSILNSLPTKLGMASETSNGLMSAEDKIAVNKINRIEADVSEKLNRDEKIKSYQLDTSSNNVKIQPINLSDEVKAMMTGKTAVSPQIAAKSIVTEHYADNSVTAAKRTAAGSVAVLVSEDFCNFDTSGDSEVVVSIPKNYTIYFGAEYKVITDAQEYIYLPKDAASVIVYGRTYGLTAYSASAVNEDDFILGAFDGKYVTMFNGRYTVDDSVVIGNGTLDGSAIKDFTLDSKKIAIQHGIILGDRSKAPYLNANFTSNFVEVVREFNINIADQYSVNIKSRQECSIPTKPTNKEYLYIYYDLGISKLNAIWASSDITTTILNNSEKLVLVGIIHNNRSVGLNREFISVNSESLKNTDVEYIDILSGRIIIDFKNKQIVAEDAKAFIDERLVDLNGDTTQYISLSDNIINDIIQSNIPYTLGAVRVDFTSDNYRLVFKKTADIKSLGLDAIALTSIENYNLSHNIENITVIKVDGNTVKSNNTISIGYIMPIDNETVILTLNTEVTEGNLNLVAKTVPGTSIVDTSNNIKYDINEELKYSMVVENLHGLYSILYNTQNGKIELHPVDDTINTKAYISLGFVSELSDSLGYTALGEITQHITLNNNRPANYIVMTGPDPDKGYDWANNRLILPNDIYLLANSQYSMYCQNMSLNKYIDNDYISYEIGMPNGSTITENIFNINCPLAGDFESRIVGKFKGNNNCLFKDINIHFEKPEGKELSILCIGDETVDNNMPGYISDYLEQLGYTPTMLGTQINSIDLNGYGMKNVSEEFGEGHKGWRLTDFMCKTKHRNGSPYYIQNNPFMNNSVFDFTYYMESNSYSKVDVVVISVGLNDITGYHIASNIEDLEDLTISQNIEQLPNLYKEMISNIHKYDSNIKIIINPTMINGIDDDFNRKSLLLTETLLYDLKDIKNVFIAPGYLTQPLFVSANRSSTENYSVYSDINNTRVGSSISTYDMNGISQSNLAYTIISTIVAATK